MKEGRGGLFDHVARMIDRLAARRPNPAERASGGGMPAVDGGDDGRSSGQTAHRPPLPSEANGVGHALGEAYAPGDDVPPEMITLMLQLARDPAGSSAG